MDLLREMLEDGTVGPDDNMSSFERAFTSDIEHLEKDAAPYRAMVRAGKAPGTVENPIDYWNRMRYVCDSRLPDFACDLLAAPGSSVPSERTFSACGYLSSAESFLDAMFFK